MPDSAETREREESLQGMGVSRKRKEDARFIRGQGSYVDDIKLPGMLFGAIVRSPYAHARIKSIDKSKALKVPGVVAVLTADDLKPVKLHWMPTLGGDVQAVLADKKVCFQLQEVAMVIASDRYAAADGAEAVEVDYEELPAIVDPHKSMAADAPIIREDIADKTEVGHGPRTHPNHIFTWDAGDKAGTDAVFANAAVTVREDILNPRVHPCPLETCGCVASFDKVRGQLTVYMTSQAPHLVRTVVAMLSGIPESKIRIIGGDIGGGFGNKVPVYPGYVIAIVASIVTGVPIKWIESRMDNIGTTGFARDYHGVGELAADKDGRIKALALHGARRSRRIQFACVGDQISSRPLQHLHRVLRHPEGVLPRRRRLHEQGAWWCCLSLLAARHRSGVPGRADDRRPGAEARNRQGGDSPAQLRQGRSSFRIRHPWAGRSTAATITPRWKRC